MPTWLARAKGSAFAAVTWLGLATAAWTLALGVEFWVRTRPTELLGAALYTPSLALVATARWSLTVGGVHLAVLVLLRRGQHALRWLGVGLAAVALWPAYTLSTDLVSGAWIAEQAYAPALRWGLFVALVLAWLAAWSWHFWGTSARVREGTPPRTRANQRLFDACFWLTGTASLPVVFVALGDLLRPYLALSEQLMFPSWLIASTLLFRALAPHPRMALTLAVCALAGAGATFPLRAIDARAVTIARARAFGATRWLSLTHATITTQPPVGLGRFDFRAMDTSPCQQTRRLPALPLAPNQRRNVILLSIDTMRRDVIGKRYGSRAVAPNVEAFARESLSFDRAVAPAPITLYSMGSLLTGHSVSQLLWHRRKPENIFRQTRKHFDRQEIVMAEWSVLRRPRFTSLAIQGIAHDLPRLVRRPEWPRHLGLDDGARAGRTPVPVASPRRAAPSVPRTRRLRLRPGPGGALPR